MSDGWTPRLQAKAYEQVLDAAARARVAGRTLAAMDDTARDKALHALADALDDRAGEILDANAADLGKATGLGVGALDRLRVTGEMLSHQAGALRRFAEQPDPLGKEPDPLGEEPDPLGEEPDPLGEEPDPLGELVRGDDGDRAPDGDRLPDNPDGDRAPDGDQAPDGVRLRRMRVPLGVLGVVYEARPITALELLGPALRAGNAVLLRGALAAVHTDEALVSVVRDALDCAGLPADTVALLPTRERSSIRYLVGAVGLLDLIVVRGGPRLVASALAEAKVPALRLSSGNCHVYVDSAADGQRALDVVMRSKADPSAPHAVEAVLVHADLARAFVPLLVETALRSGVSVHGDERVCRLVPGIPEATAESLANGYRDASMAVGVVDSIDAAMDVIDRHGQGHTEVIVTRDESAARAFLAGVDAAMVAVNVPTTVGQATVFATQKQPVRGVVRPIDLTTTRWLAWDGSPEG